MLTASAASQAVAQLLSTRRREAGEPQVEDVVPAPRGAALGSSVLPLVLAGILTGVVAVALVVRRRSDARRAGRGARFSRARGDR